MNAPSPLTVASRTCSDPAHCSCSGGGGTRDAAMEIASSSPESSSPPTVNGVALMHLGADVHPEEWAELAHAELLRQEALRRGYLSGASANGSATAEPPTLPGHPPGARERAAIERMLDDLVPRQTPTATECERYFDANKVRYKQGEQLHVRHILFAVTPGVNVHALVQKAESVLIQLSRGPIPEGTFERLARENSNCPSSADGGDLGWIGPHECAPELANELFYQPNGAWGMGVHPRLVHTRFGFHIIDVLGVHRGKTPAFAEVADRVALELSNRNQAVALRQFMQQLAAEADIQGIDLSRADSPLMQ